MDFKAIWTKVFPVLKNKYMLSSVVFLGMLIFFSQNNLLDRANNISKLRQLRIDKAYYLDAIEQAERKMHELKTNRNSLEKFAREEYLMKCNNEDIFIIVEEPAE